jgi:hypothetical protein
MKEADIMRILAEQSEDEAIGYYGSPVHHDKVYIIMWHSQKSGGTYTELRKSIRGKNKFIAGLNMMGVDLREVQVIEQPKVWVPVPKSQMKSQIQTRRRSATSHGKGIQTVH